MKTLRYETIQTYKINYHGNIKSIQQASKP